MVTLKKNKKIVFSTQPSKMGKEMKVIVIPKKWHKDIEEYESTDFRNGTPMKVTLEPL